MVIRKVKIKSPKPTGLDKTCAERLIDVAMTLGVAQGVASTGQLDQENLQLVTDALSELESTTCPIGEKATKAIEEIRSKTDDILNNKGEVSMEDSVSLQESFNDLVKGIIGDRD